MRRTLCIRLVVALKAAMLELSQIKLVEVKSDGIYEKEEARDQ